MKKVTFKSWILIGIAVSLFLVFSVGLISYLSLNNLREDQKWVEHTETVINHSQGIMKALTEAESSQRGYVITGNEEFLQVYGESLPKIDILFNQLSSLLADNPEQVKHLDSLKLVVDQRLQIIAQVISNRRKANYKLDENEITLLSVGKRKMDEVRKLTDEINNEENRLLIIRKANSEESTTRTILVIVFGTLLIFIIIIVLFRFIQSSFAGQVKAQDQLNATNKDLEKLFQENKEKTWILTGTSLIRERIQGELSVDEMAKNIINNVAAYAQSDVAAIYLAEEDEIEFILKAGYALTITPSTKKRFNITESWVGQVAADKKPIIITGDLIKNLEITSGLLSTQPIESLIVPFYFNNKIKGLLELGFKEKITKKQQDFINLASEVIGVAINSAQSRELLQTLFEETQMQSEELEAQQEELRVTNEELINKTQMLQSSEEELRVQQEELKEINFELEEKAKLLEDKNRVIEEAREAIVVKMQQLEQSGKYKSEFLANMSHELRTPLNSILILARILKDNKSDNLSEEEAKYANVIFKAGNDLLTLINDILDLAKIESGKVELNYEEIKFMEISEDLQQLFSEVAKSKQINFKLSIDSSLPEKIATDKIRLEQILKNLLSNAFKFTPKDGQVTVGFNLIDQTNLKIEVSDTGIGIKPEKQKLIFEAFQQADGSTSREYGGTGLGLSICKELAHRMGGEITLKSEANKGSIFSLIIPLAPHEATILKHEDEEPEVLESFTRISKVEENMQVRIKPILLIVEDDPNFNAFLKNYGEEKGFEVVQVYDGEQAVSKAIELIPDAILLDVMLPGIDGWKVLKRLKSEYETSAIPIHMMSAGDQREQKAIKSGALSFIKKPVDINMLDKVFSAIMKPGEVNYKNILLVEDHEVQSDALANLFKAQQIDVKQAYTGKEAMDLLLEQDFDCIILDLNLPDISGLDLLEKIKEDPKFKELPVVINTAMELDQEKMNRLLKYSNATVMKSTKSSDRLIDEVNLFLHKIQSDDLKPKSINREETSELKGKTILLVDDDMRNIFALSAILDGYGFKVEIANDGMEALEKLDSIKNINMVLMDIMMPRMDGFEAMKEIRKQSKFKNLPIIALTAKAMKEDRDECIAAGANDYITKPVDVDKLFSLVKIWMA